MENGDSQLQLLVDEPFCLPPKGIENSTARYVDGTDGHSKFDCNLIRALTLQDLTVERLPSLRSKSRPNLDQKTFHHAAIMLQVPFPTGGTIVVCKFFEIVCPYTTTHDGWTVPLSTPKISRSIYKDSPQPGSKSPGTAIMFKVL
jgi:hypothetical protein